MKRIISIFVCILTLCVFVPENGWGLSCPDTCSGRDCDANHDLIIGNIVNGDSPLFQCGDGCGHGTFVVVVGRFYIDKDDDIMGRDDFTSDSYSLFKCDTHGDNSWDVDSTVTSSWCTDAISARGDLNAEFKSKKDGVEKTAVCDDDRTGCGVKFTNGGCVGWYCKSGYTWDGTRCKDDNIVAKQQNCENTHGNWNASTETCTCDASKGLTGPDSTTGKCSCAESGYVWSDSENKCVNPDQAMIDACEESATGARWDSDHCDCTGAGNGMVTSSDDRTCVTDPIYSICTGSGGDWERTSDIHAGVCKCDTAKGFKSEPEANKCVCSDTDKIYDVGEGMCVRSPQAWCENTGGTWNASSDTCTCDPAKFVKDVSGSDPKRCECINTDYDWKSDKRQGCELSQDAKDCRSKLPGYKNTCETNWGGVFDPQGFTEPDVCDESTWECDCTAAGDGKRQSADKVSCQCDESNGWVRTSVTQYTCFKPTYTDLKDHCAPLVASGEADWIEGPRSGIDGYCRCKDTTKVYVYGPPSQCVDIVLGQTMEQIKCQAIGSDAQMGIDGICYCRVTKRPPVDGKCPPVNASPVPSSPVGGNNIAQQITELKKKIDKASTGLDEISNTFGQSRWKTASGNFNGARLASDSIAGVVLGTVGGVVTSNVIKKNQVKGGFEKLQCTVGGQMVADFGDQFRVGVR